jgi:hypothetical protein
MPEPLRPTDDELGRALGALGDELDYPDATGLHTAVRRRLDEPRRIATPWSRVLAWVSSGDAAGTERARAWQPVAAAAALVVAVFIGSLVAFPTVRQAVADWLGVRGIGITIVPSLTPLPTEHGSLLLGTPVSLEEARATVPWPIVLPDDPSLGPPDEVYVDRSRFASGVVSLVWSARPGYPAASTTGAGLVLTEFRGSVNEQFFQKVAGPGTTIEHVSVNGHFGYWISGAPHEFFAVDPNGNPVPQTIHLAGDVLIWEDGELTLRIESALTKDDAIRVGSKIR